LTKVSVSDIILEIEGVFMARPMTIQETKERALTELSQLIKGIEAEVLTVQSVDISTDRHIAEYRFKVYKHPKTVKMERWLVSTIEGKYSVMEGDTSFYESLHSCYEKVRLLDSYEVILP
jgi:hypothetical protein